MTRPAAPPPPDLSEPTILEVLTEFFAEPDHNQCRSMGPRAEALCLIAGMEERGIRLDLLQDRGSAP